MTKVTGFGGSERRSGPEDRRTEGSLFQYFKGFIVKLLENLSSAKVWFFILPFIASTIYMGWLIYTQVQFVRDLITYSISKPEILAAINASFKVATETFISWCTFNVSLAGTIIVVRETFKVSKLKALNESEDEATKKEIKEMSA